MSLAWYVVDVARAAAFTAARATRRADAGDDGAQRQRSEGGAEEAPTAENAPRRFAAAGSTSRGRSERS